MRKTINLLLVLLLTVSLLIQSACGNENGGTNSGSKTVNAEIFSAYITEKVLQDISADESLKLAAGFNIVAAKGETEDAQIVIKPDKDVASCNITVGKLTMSDGTEFPAANISLYYQKYIEIKTRTTGMDDDLFGFYPDMLLPYEKAVEYKENVIKRGQNQSIVLSAKVDAAQKAGVYTGTATVSLDGTVKTVGVKIEVKDVELPEIKHLLTNYNTDYVLIVDGELNDTPEMFEKYYSYMLDYNITARRFPGATNAEGLKSMIRKYYDKISSYEIPADGTSSFLPERFSELLKAVAEISLEDGRNYFEKARYWLYCIDEPLQNDIVQKSNETLLDFHNTAALVAEEIEGWDNADNGEITKSLLAEYIRNAKALVTTRYTEEIPDVDIWCPVVANMARSADRVYYEDEDEYWIYSVNTSINPQPTQCIDDYNGLTASRALGWICSDYNISGRLYYETCYFQKISYTGGFHYEKCDPYTEPMRYPNYNGDGWLLYPGARYGVYGPIASNRLVAVRDSVDDYEILYQLKEKYGQAGYSADEVLGVLYDSLYSGVYVSAGGAELFNAREQLFNLHALADKGVYITKCERTERGYSLSVVGENATVKNNGRNVSSYSSFEIVLTGNSNSLSVEKDGIEFSYVLGGKKQVLVYYSDSSKSKGVEDSAKFYTHSLVNGASIGFDGTVEEITFKPEQNRNVYIRPNGIESYLTKNTQEVAVVLYNPTDTAYRAVFYVEGAGSSSITITSQIDTVLLKPGENTVVLTGLNMLNWNAIGNATGIQIRVSDAAELNQLYLCGIYLTEGAK